MNGLYTNQGLKGFLEWKDFRDIEMVLPFIGIIIDTLIDENGGCTLTKLFSEYSDMLLQMFRDERNEWWTCEDMGFFEKMIENLKRDEVLVFGEYHGKRLFTEKFHMLDHSLKTSSEPDRFI